MTQTPESPTPVPVRAPTPVTALAAERGLGDLHNARIVASPAAIAKPGAVLFVPSVIVGAVGLPRSGGILPILGLVGLVGAVVGFLTLAYAAKTWLAGADDWYLYGNGLVARRQRRLQAVTWSEVSSLTRARMGHRASRRGAFMNPNTLRGYRVELQDGTRLFLTVSDFIDAGKLLATQLEDLATHAGVPITG